MIKDKARRLKVQQAYKKRTKERWQQYHKSYYLAHKEEILKNSRIYRKNNSEKIKLRKQTWALKNKEKINAKRRAKWPLVKEKRSLYFKRKRQNDTNFRLTQNLRSRLYRTIKIKSVTKFASLKQLLDCTLDELIQHLESQFQDNMSWENYGEWHIDHIKPCASFNMVDIEDQKKCFNYRNLQPLWESDNCSKRDSLDWKSNTI